MITDGMTWNEVITYHKKLKEKLFHNKKFQSDIQRRKIDRFRKSEDGIIFQYLREYELGNQDLILGAHYLLSQTLEPINVLFSTFYYRKEKYVAFYLNNGEIFFFRWHAIIRYYQRFHGEPEPCIDNRDIAQMLMYNAASYSFDYLIPNKEHFNKLYVVRDGVFFGYADKDLRILKTFVTKKMLFKSQEVFNTYGSQQYKEYMKREYNVAI